MRQEGTVILRVAVDDSGSPTGVWVEETSGFPILDQAAQKQVSGFFRFKVGSARVLRVPISFQL
jgi:protein TonB